MNHTSAQDHPGAQSFGLTQTVGYVEGIVRLFQMDADGTFAPTDDPLAQLSSIDLEELSQRATADMESRQGYWSKFIPTPKSEEEDA
jgi:hypothetical protein